MFWPVWTVQGRLLVQQNNWAKQGWHNSNWSGFKVRLGTYHYMYTSLLHCVFQINLVINSSYCFLFSHSSLLSGLSMLGKQRNTLRRKVTLQPDVFLHHNFQELQSRMCNRPPCSGTVNCSLKSLFIFRQFSSVCVICPHSLSKNGLIISLIMCKIRDETKQLITLQKALWMEREAFSSGFVPAAFPRLHSVPMFVLHSSPQSFVQKRGPLAQFQCYLNHLPI